VRVGHTFLFALPFAAVWWAITGDDASSWIVGAPVAAIAGLVSVSLESPPWWQFQARGALRFAGFFLFRSIQGGVDVAWRAVHPRLPLSPDFLDYSLRLPDDASRVVFASVVSLLPGTLTVEIHDDKAIIHALQADESTLRQLRELEQHVTLLFGLEDAP
jgi:multicomponent Na+:H+ antiporter subunit E